MSFEFAYRYRQETPSSGYRELDRVALTAAVACDEGGEMPSGSEGTIVSVFNGGEAYVIEFSAPVGTLATVEPQHLRLVESVSL